MNNFLFLYNERREILYANLFIYFKTIFFSLYNNNTNKNDEKNKIRYSGNFTVN